MSDKVDIVHDPQQTIIHGFGDIKLLHNIIYEKYYLAKSQNPWNREMQKRRRRVPTYPPDPSYTFLEILNMESISTNEHEMQIWELSIKWTLNDRKL